MDKIPHNRDAEESAIGSIFINPDVYYDIREIVCADDFYIHRLRWAFEAFGRLHEKREPIDSISFGREMNSKHDEFGGLAYEMTLTNRVPTSLNAANYAKLVKADSVRRRLLQAASTVTTMAYDEHMEVDDLVGNSAQAVEEATRTATNGAIESVKDVTSRVYDLTDKNSRLEEDEKDLGLRTGYIDLDNLLRGIDDTNLVIVGGRPSMGKSAFLQNIARQVAVDQKKNVAFFSMEASNDEVSRRWLSQIAEVDSKDIKEGTLEDREWPKFTHAVDVLSTANIFMDDTAALSPMQIKTKCKRLKMTDGLDLIVVDYLQLMRQKGLSGIYEITTYVARALKEIAQDLHVPVMAAAQLNRKLEDRKDKRPMLSDLKDSGEIEQAANIVIFPYRAAYYSDEVDTQNVTEIIVAKHRDGETGTINLVMRPQYTKFENAVTKKVSFP